MKPRLITRRTLTFRPQDDTPIICSLCLFQAQPDSRGETGVVGFPGPRVSEDTSRRFIQDLSRGHGLRSRVRVTGSGHVTMLFGCRFRVRLVGMGVPDQGYVREDVHYCMVSKVIL